MNFPPENSENLKAVPYSQAKERQIALVTPSAIQVVQSNGKNIAIHLGNGFAAGTLMFIATCVTKSQTSVLLTGTYHEAKVFIVDCRCVVH